MPKRLAVMAVLILAILWAPPAIFAETGAATQPVKTVSADELFILLRPDESAQVPALIDRELFRQAMFMAARDGMGLWPRDAVKREPKPAHPGQ